jgi:dihydrofolate synthase / folylpolyglutamate synthase
VVCAPQLAEAMRVFASVCDVRSASLVRVGEDVSWQQLEGTLEGQMLRIDGPRGSRVIRIPFAAAYEAENAALAVAALDALRSTGVTLTDDCVAHGMGRTIWPGRFQVLSASPLLLLDGAHNPASMRRLAESLSMLLRGKETVYVLGFSSDKDVTGSVAELSHTGGRFVLTRSSHPRALEPADAAMRLSGLGLRVVCEPQLEAALWRARVMAGADGAVVVAGSLYVIGDVLRLWQDDRDLHVRWGQPPAP